MKSPTQRFSDRVEDYLRYRPHYPAAMLAHLVQHCGFSRHWAIADIGSGTGLLAEQWLGNGNLVYGVEPNPEMRQAAATLWAAEPQFISIAGQAEQTTLPDAGVDCITVGQAFHWFEPAATRREFQRILKPEGWVVLVWNQRQLDTTPFLQDYEQLLQTYAPDYKSVRARLPNPEQLATFYHPGTVHSALFPNQQSFDAVGLYGRMMSSSYIPKPGEPQHIELRQALQDLFDTHQSQGQVQFHYQTALYYGQLA